MASESPITDGSPAGSSTVRIVISLALFVHLFFVFVAMSSNLARSEFQRRLLNRFAFYTQLFNLDLDFTPFHLTHATEEDVDHRIEILPAGGEVDQWLVLPDVGYRGGERYQRYQRMGRVMAFLSEQEGMVSRIAQSVGAHFVNFRGIEPKQVRCRRHMLQGWTAITDGTAEQRDPDSEAYFQQVYAANCVVMQGGRVEVVKVESVGQVAGPTSQEEDSDDGRRE